MRRGAGALPIRAGLRLWEIVLLSAVIQWGMLPLLAAGFSSREPAGPISNIPAVLLTGNDRARGISWRCATFRVERLASLLAKGVSFSMGLLLATVDWFGRVPHTSYRIPGPPVWLVIAFFARVFRAGCSGARMTPTATGSNGASQPARPAIMRGGIAAAALLTLAVLVAIYPFAPTTRATENSK